MRLSKGLTLALCFLAILLMTSTAIAPETTAGIQGSVKDASGAALTKATVEVTSPALQGVKKQDASSSGTYRFSNLPPGDYIVTVTAPGFKTLKQGGIK